jgi:hypothetical protein
LTPTSVGAVSVDDATVGTWVPKMVQGHAAGTPVVNVHVKSAANELPATSLTPEAPPLTTAVYVVASASAAFGVTIALCVFAL